MSFWGVYNPSYGDPRECQVVREQIQRGALERFPGVLVSRAAYLLLGNSFGQPLQDYGKQGQRSMSYCLRAE